MIARERAGGSKRHRGSELNRRAEAYRESDAKPSPSRYHGFLRDGTGRGGPGSVGPASRGPERGPGPIGWAKAEPAGPRCHGSLSHGMILAGAAHRLDRFLARARADGARCVLVIHGKGRSSRPDSGPVLKSMVDRWLKLRSEVLAFCSARPEHGGTGSIYVLLRP